MAFGQTTLSHYALSIKGGLYNRQGEITNSFESVALFNTIAEAHAFRAIHDPRHNIVESTVLVIRVFVSQAEGVECDF